MTASQPAYDSRRAIKIFQELGSRSVGALPKLGGGGADVSRCGKLKEEILALLAPFGEPALRVPATTLAEVDQRCRELEARNPNRGDMATALAVLQGTWKVQFSDAPPPSNGALGPLRGRAYQTVDASSQSYTNELYLFGNALSVLLQATFMPKRDVADALRVTFCNITLSFFGLDFPPVKFPNGTERTWLLTYTDDDLRIVRAGVDGGRSVVRNLGLLAREEGQAPDAYLFVLTRAKGADLPKRSRNPLVEALARRELKSQLLAACGTGDDRGAKADAACVGRVEALMDKIALVNPTLDPASSPLLCGTWDVFWTTESELLAVTANGFFGLPCKAAYQKILRERKKVPGGYDFAYSLDNAIDFEGGFLRVASACKPELKGGRVNFRFESCKAKWKALEVPLPPVGAGWFEVLYLDDDLRVCKDSRGDLQICTRRRN